VTRIQPRSLLLPPGMPEFESRRRYLPPGRHRLSGRAWAGWTYEWDAAPGDYELCSRATDAAGNTQPTEIPWNTGGYANNAVHRVAVTVREGAGAEGREA
jgi:hypothetical protein